MTPKQKLFIKEYLIDLNATRAAISAGYSEKTAYSQGQRLLKHVEVSAKLSESVQKLTEKLEISTEYVLTGIKDIVERSIKRGDEYDAFAALKGYELLGKYRKLFTDKIEHSGQIENVTFDATHVSDEQLAAWEASLAPTGSGQG